MGANAVKYYIKNVYSFPRLVIAATV